MSPWSRSRVTCPWYELLFRDSFSCLDDRLKYSYFLETTDQSRRGLNVEAAYNRSLISSKVVFLIAIRSHACNKMCFVVCDVLYDVCDVQLWRSWWVLWSAWWATASRADWANGDLSCSWARPSCGKLLQSLSSASTLVHWSINSSILE